MAKCIITSFFNVKKKQTRYFKNTTELSRGLTPTEFTQFLSIPRHYGVQHIF